MAVIFFVSAGALLFQVAQTRLFSAVFGYHLTYLVISVSLLGVGWGATLSAVVDARSYRPSLGQLGLGATASILLALFVQAHVDPSSALWLSVTAAYVLGFPPFAFASWIVVRSLRERSAQAGKLYAADLAGASTGSILALVGLPMLGAPGLYGLAATLAAVSATLILWARASGPESPTVEPDSTVPCLGIAPVRARIASSSVVFPLWNGPTSAMHRGPRGLLTSCPIAASFIWSSALDWVGGLDALPASGIWQAGKTSLRIFASCPGRGAAFSRRCEASSGTMHRRAGTHRIYCLAWTPDQQRTAIARRRRA